MFEEVCLVCGKHVQDDGQTYCSEDCQNVDSSSPSISSASSALSSPHLGGTAGGDVPPLVPSALGSALRKYKHSHDHSVSSSASSTSWSVVTDDDYDGSALATPYESGFHGSVDSFNEGSSKSAHYPYSMKPSALSYARRPSGTNNRSTVANLHKRTSSEHVHGPQSAPLQSFLSTDDDGLNSEFGLSSRDESDSDLHPAKSASTPSTKSRRNRNRASLPAYFSLLQMTTPYTENRSPSKSSSPAQTIARPSPPTPKIPLTTLASGLSRSTSTVLTGSIHTTPRGRRRIPTDSRASSSSRSGANSPRRAVESSPSRLRSRLDSKASVEQVFDWSSVSEPPRGRAAVRRNSSPPPKMMLSAVALEDHNRAFATVNKDEELRPGFRKYRGRIRAEGFLDASAPGLGHGRSGLLDRERRGAHFV